LAHHDGEIAGSEASIAAQRIENARSFDVLAEACCLAGTGSDGTAGMAGSVG
jgi:hypothetical protein